MDVGDLECCKIFEKWIYNHNFAFDIVTSFHGDKEKEDDFIVQVEQVAVSKINNKR